MTKARVKSPWILHFDCGSCNGCDIEILAALTPKFDAERFGVVNIGDPKQADLIVVTGPANTRNSRVLRSLYDQTPDPKVVMVVGACGATGGVFRNCKNVLGGVDKVIPVDVYVPGCAARPEQIIDGLLLALKKLEEKSEGEGKRAAERREV